MNEGSGGALVMILPAILVAAAFAGVRILATGGSYRIMNVDPTKYVQMMERLAFRWDPTMTSRLNIFRNALGTEARVHWFGGRETETILMKFEHGKALTLDMNGGVVPDEFLKVILDLLR